MENHGEAPSARYKSEQQIWQTKLYSPRLELEKTAQFTTQTGPSLWPASDKNKKVNAHLIIVPPSCQVDVVMQKKWVPALGHLCLHGLQQLLEPLKGMHVRTDPVQVHLLQCQSVSRITVYVPAIITWVHKPCPKECTCKHNTSWWIVWEVMCL